jgi:hypothetical protein
MTTIDLETWTREARELGERAGCDAASWVLDGRNSQEHYIQLARMMDDGDPRLDEYLPARPNLSGEWSDDLTPIGLYEAVTGEDHAAAEERAGLAYETLVGSVVDALADAWEEGVSETFDHECERLVREAIA